MFINIMGEEVDVHVRTVDCIEFHVDPDGNGHLGKQEWYWEVTCCLTVNDGEGLGHGLLYVDMVKHWYSVPRAVYSLIQEVRSRIKETRNA